MSAVHRILSAARAELDYPKRPHDWTKFGQWYARAIANGDQYFVTAPWCDMFVSWCAHKAGVASQVGQFASTMHHATWFKNRHRWKRTPHVGAVAFFNFPGGDPIDHVGLVEWVGNDGGVVVLEGNAGSPSKVRRTRYYSFIAGYGYPGYPTA